MFSLKNFKNYAILMCCFCLVVQASKPEGRIIGGTEVDILKYPYVVSIRSKYSDQGIFVHQWAGSIYSSKVVITSAQCIEGISGEKMVLVVAGANTRTAGDGQVYIAHDWIGHEKYDSWTVDYDIGLIFIHNEFDFTNPAIKPIPIIQKRPINGAIAHIAGWGYRESFGPSSYYLEEARVPIVSDDNCKDYYGKASISERMICAGDLMYGGKDACQGDTGGPLVFRGHLVGLVSWGEGCGRPKVPSVYTYVPNLTSWIHEKTSKLSK